ncbi:unnamed protein product [Dibothriocephalus latus]|uniref:Proteasome subunit alpha type n=1 Tax=Dibothriocephalus latus TaxID=60516 RepID=A0A3P7LP86_DIBLA|nr:unnamed protein product [Dibothriocephalus latus]
MSAKYDRAITVFSPDGHLFQVEYAQEAVKKGSTAIGVKGKNCLTADARVLIDRIRIECKSYKLTVEDPVSVEYVARYMAQIKQKYTQSNGRRPFGVSTLIVGINQDGTPHLYQTDPSGTHFEWLANAIGKNSKAAREFLEKNYSPAAVETEEDTIKMAIKALVEVVQTGAKHMELAVMRAKKPEKPGDSFVEWKMLNYEEIDKYVQAIEKEREEEAEKKKQKKEAAGGSY